VEGNEKERWRGNRGQKRAKPHSRGLLFFCSGCLMFGMAATKKMKASWDNFAIFDHNTIEDGWQFAAGWR